MLINIVIPHELKLMIHRLEKKAFLPFAFSGRVEWIGKKGRNEMSRRGIMKRSIPPLSILINFDASAKSWKAVNNIQFACKCVSNETNLTPFNWINIVGGFDTRIGISMRTFFPLSSQENSKRRKKSSRVLKVEFIHKIFRRCFSCRTASTNGADGS